MCHYQSITSLTLVLQGVRCISETYLPMLVCAWLQTIAVRVEYDRFYLCIMLCTAGCVLD